MKSIRIIIALIGGFALSYVPNNFMDEKYEDIAFFFIVGLVVIAALWIVISKFRKKIL
ncbi:hypothetical protein ACMA1I_14350 [Pontibacter sp. 13R65]|uniref:hypothetical protein n=1 Tax=Pontibacter sp. 13R65 TaxID=3127458 RepID=UPI00301E2AF9